MSLAERILRRIAGRPKQVPDYDVIDRIERELDAQRRAEEREVARRAAVEACAREGHLEPADDAVELLLWGSVTPIRLASRCPRCGVPTGDVTADELEATAKLRAAGLL